MLFLTRIRYQFRKRRARRRAICRQKKKTATGDVEDMMQAWLMLDHQHPQDEKMLILRDNESLPSLEASVSSFNSLDDSVTDDSSATSGRRVRFLLPSAVKPTISSKTKPVGSKTLLAGPIPLAKVQEETSELTFAAGSRLWMVGTMPKVQFEDKFCYDEIRYDTPPNVDVVFRDRSFLRDKKVSEKFSLDEIFDVEVSLRDYLLHLESQGGWNEVQDWEDEIRVHSQKVVVVEQNNSVEVYALEDTVPDLTISFDDGSWSDDDATEISSSSIDSDMLIRSTDQNVLGNPKAFLAKDSTMQPFANFEGQDTSKFGTEPVVGQVTESMTVLVREINFLINDVGKMIREGGSGFSNVDALAKQKTEVLYVEDSEVNVILENVLERSDSIRLSEDDVLGAKAFFAEESSIMVASRGSSLEEALGVSQADEDLDSIVRDYRSFESSEVYGIVKQAPPLLRKCQGVSMFAPESLLLMIVQMVLLKVSAFFR